MKEIEPYFVIEDDIDGGQWILKNLEKYGRVCYKSEDKITMTSAANFLRNAIKRGHLRLIEHEKVTVRIICDRGVTHEIVRHRIGSYSQESTRYCDYTGEMVVIRPFFFKSDMKKYAHWLFAMESAERSYCALRKVGATPQEARSVLPNSLKTEIVVTYNLREWRHFFSLRCSKASHPQMRQVAIPLLKEFQKQIPVLFEDFVIDEKNLCLICAPILK